jgi:hypothetical protein
VLCENCYVKEFINCEIRSSHNNAIVADSFARKVLCFYRKTKSLSGRKKKLQNANMFTGFVIFRDINLGCVPVSVFFRTATKLQARNQPLSHIRHHHKEVMREGTLCFLFYIENGTEAVIYKSKGKGK